MLCSSENKGKEGSFNNEFTKFTITKIYSAYKAVVPFPFFPSGFYVAHLRGGGLPFLICSHLRLHKIK